ncbi:MAG TPA: integrase arm-type DNA-binding domain-containing protein [Sphingobium sp.]
MGKLTALKIKAALPGRHPDGDGLHLIVRETGSRQWLLRIQADGKRRDLGLGTADTSSRSKEAQAEAERIPILQRRLLTLVEAREKADAYRRMVRAGIDPVSERNKAAPKIPTFEEAAQACHTDMKAGWKNQRHIDSWLASLDTHIIPHLGNKTVDTIDNIAVRDAIAPIWLTMPETAQRILQRIGVVLDFAHIKGWRPTEASLRSVRKGLPRQPVSDKHFASMPYADLPDYYQALVGEENTVGRDALKFTILNAVRSVETRFAVWSEIDMDQATWTIPAGRMKMNAQHIVPLSPAAMEILRCRWEIRTSDDGLVFYSTVKKAISDMTMTKVLRKDGIKAFTVHGFRSTFTDWAAEKTEFAKEIVDKALAHKLPDRVEAAYRRTDFFDKRRLLMNLWANHCAGDSNVVPFAARA